MSIRFDDKLNKELSRVVKNFNAKVIYHKHKTRGKGILPDKIKVSEIKAKYSDKNRFELEKQLKLYRAFGKRDSLNKAASNHLSEWEKNFFESNIKKTKAFYDEEIADLKRIIGDQPEYHLRLHNRLETLVRQREELDTDINTLSDDQIEGFRRYFNKAERSELTKQRGFRLYLEQLTRTMKILGYSKQDIEALVSKFDVLSENEFTEMLRNEDLIDSIYDIIDSPKGRGQYELMTDEIRAENMIADVIYHADELVRKYKTSA